MSLTSKTYSNPSQLLQRNESLFINKNILVAGNIVDDYPLHLEALADSSTFCFNDFRYYHVLSDKLTGSKVHFTANYQGDEKFGNKKELDVRQLLYEYEWYDWQKAAHDRDYSNRAKYIVRPDPVMIYPDTLSWIRDFAYSYNVNLVVPPPFNTKSLELIYKNI